MRPTIVLRGSGRCIAPITAISFVFRQLLSSVSFCASGSTTIKVCNGVGFEGEDAVVFEPEEHDLLEVGLGGLEEPIQLVELGEFDYLEDLA